MRDERGSVLALMPAAVVVFLVLGALAVDASLVYLGERAVSNLAASVANDAATRGIDLERYYGTGELVLDHELVAAVAEVATGASGLDHLEDLVVETDVVGDDVVVVRVEAQVRSLFSRVLPGGVERRRVDASAEAEAERA